MKTYLRSIVWSFSAVLLAAGACGVEGGGQAESVEAIPNLITSVKLKNGAQLDFHEPEPGRILVVGTGAIPETPGKPSPLAIYESLSGQKAPPELLKAQERADVARLSRPALRDAAEPVFKGVEDQLAPLRQQLQGKDGVGASVHALTGAQFSAKYCPGGSYDFFYCLLNRTGGGSTEVTSVDWLRTYANSYQGTIKLELAYKNLWGNWITIGSANVLQDTPTQDNTRTFITYSNDTWKASVTEAVGDGYHRSVYGQK